MSEEDDILRPLNRDIQDSEYQKDTEIEPQLEPVITTKDISKKLDITKKYKFDDLTTLNFWGYSVGHFFNDLCAAVWFNYLPYYLSAVRNFDAQYAVLSGQFCDGIATPVVGLLSDRTNTSIGKRTPWYLFGTILVCVTFLPIYIYQITEGASSAMEMLFFISLPGLFNVGWASVQISNMSLVPSLTCCTSRRDILNSRRNTMTFVANIAVFIICLIFTITFEEAKDTFEALAIVIVILGLLLTAFFLFTVKEVPLCRAATEQAKFLKDLLDQKVKQQIEKIVKNKSKVNQDQNKNKNQSNMIMEQDNDALKQQEDQNEEQDQMFRNTLKQQKNPKKSKNTMSMGSMMMAKENDIEFQVEEDGTVHQSLSSLRMTLKAREIQQKRMSSQEGNKSNWKQWFRESMFYICAAIYMLVRLYCNVTQSLLQFYLPTVLQFGDEGSNALSTQATVVPLVMFIFSSVTSSFVEILFQKIGRKRTYLIGFLFGCASTVGLLLLSVETKQWVYLVAAIIGVAQALCLNTGITLISDVIGVRGSEGAFVFGVYSFLDKFLTGIVMFVILAFKSFEDSPSAIAWTISLVPFVSIVGAGICIYFIQTKNDGFKHNNQSNVSVCSQTKEIEQLNKELAV
ncbi:Major facilitator superfamily domain, general substrate transporter [Pseudocohnilembus persalinus]|uniref:Major facilitator superfamily domain, general substrate transporter n=1 Tax=Pseudocohnilembus persalinus TaxID=266149 RepID=A0A0V0QI53_PSEPJ|nr:Major facilitator superfamily domain, general substrate transporter [Pseudocohnilembus persalinus]|eukprot:KRX01868.1 Major facilitator superfamily domain, general substrate transporter [Pseudocohnilembus persalinus]